MTEAATKIQPDSTGVSVREIVVTTLINNVLTDVVMQVVAVADEDGNVLSSPTQWQAEVLEALNTANEWLEQIAESLG